jgi:hypothetical protein
LQGSAGANAALRLRLRREANPADPIPATISSKGGSFMSRELVAHNRPVFDQLHPNIYRAAVGLVAWFALAAWVLFDRRNDIELPLDIVSVLLLVAVLLPWSLSLVWKRHRMPDERQAHRIPFRDWRIGDFAVWGGKLRGTQAAIDMLLPLAAVAFGLTAIGIVFLICASFAR